MKKTRKCRKGEKAVGKCCVAVRATFQIPLRKEVAAALTQLQDRMMLQKQRVKEAVAAGRAVRRAFRKELAR